MKMDEFCGFQNMGFQTLITSVILCLLSLLLSKQEVPDVLFHVKRFLVVFEVFPDTYSCVKAGPI